MDKFKLMDDFVFDLDVSYGVYLRNGKREIFVTSFTDFEYKKIKRKARELGLKFRKIGGELIITEA